MTKKIIPRLMGGLGNQLFIYAAARRLALKNNAELVLDTESGFLDDHQYQRSYQLEHFNIPCRKATFLERLGHSQKILRSLNYRWNKRLPLSKCSYLKQQGFAFEPLLLRLKQERTLYLEGYWQSQRYFIDIEPQIRSDLNIIHPLDHQNQMFADRIHKELSIAIHVRFFNEPGTVPDGSLKINNVPTDYYRHAVAVMKQRFPTAHYFVFSERPREAEELLPLNRSQMTLVQHNHDPAFAFADLWLMTQCQHFIIPNSTFSWWGAWLASNFGKIVIAPKLDRSFSITWSDPHLLPPEWLQI